MKVNTGRPDYRELCGHLKVPFLFQTLKSMLISFNAWCNCFFLLSPKNTLFSTLSARLRESSYVLVVSNTLWCLCYMMLATILCLRCNRPSLVLRVLLFPSYFWNFSCAWWCTSLILAFWRQRQVGCFEISCLHSKFQASLSYIVRPVLKKKKKTKQTTKQNLLNTYCHLTHFVVRLRLVPIAVPVQGSNGPDGIYISFCPPFYIFLSLESK